MIFQTIAFSLIFFFFGGQPCGASEHRNLNIVNSQSDYSMMLLAPLISTAEKLGTGPWHNLACQAILVFGYMYLVEYISQYMDQSPALNN